jgi:hypothetical protein
MYALWVDLIVASGALVEAPGIPGHFTVRALWVHTAAPPPPPNDNNAPDSHVPHARVLGDLQRGSPFRLCGGVCNVKVSQALV